MRLLRPDNGLAMTLVFWLVPVLPSHAAFNKSDRGTTSGTFLKLPSAARAIGMGETGTTFIDSADSLYWNPARIGMNGSKQISLSRSLYVENITQTFGAFTMPWSEGRGWGASL